jgi:hypothetical protein
MRWLVGHDAGSRPRCDKSRPAFLSRRVGALTRLIKETATQQVEFAGTTLNLVRSTGDQWVCGVALRMSERIMSDEFDGLDATEKAGIEAALNRCRDLAAQIASELRNKRSDHVDKLSLADLCASLEHAADVLGQKGRRPVENTPAPVVKGSQTRHR